MTSEIETQPSEVVAPNAAPKWRKLLLQFAAGMVFGGLVGFGFGYLADRYLDAAQSEGVSFSVAIAGAVAVIYIVMAVIVLAGSLSPKMGAMLLNVEDEAEVRELQSQLLNSGLGMVLWGVALMALALAAPVGPLPTPAALVIAAVGLVSGLWFAWKTYRSSDELLLAINLEAGALTYGLMLVVLGGWGMLAHLDYVTGPQPLDLLTACYVLALLATFISAGRRGMLMPR